MARRTGRAGRAAICAAATLAVVGCGSGGAGEPLSSGFGNVEESATGPPRGFSDVEGDSGGGGVPGSFADARGGSSLSAGFRDLQEPGDAAGALDSTAFCRQGNRLWCEGMFLCGTDDFSSLEECVAVRYEKKCQRRLLPAVASGRVVVDLARAAGCLECWSTFIHGPSACGGTDPDNECSPPGRGCWGVTRGTVPAGGACDRDDECAAYSRYSDDQADRGCSDGICQ